ncbi:MAG TPA: hypothetical protein VE800_06685 [Actinomycetota bacterium]|jgi:hypothetical protein|nr:hypothetical protein [Actinomycetota bacterium]
MDDGFNLGDPSKRPAKLSVARPPHRGEAFDARILLIPAGLVVAAVLAFVFLRGADEAGRRIADDQGGAVAQVARAQDVAAQAALGRAVVLVRTLYVEQGSFEPAGLADLDASIDFTPGASTGPTSIAYRSDGDAFGVAVRSASGTCWWTRGDSSGTTTYGSGEPCTGQAALGASQPAW